VITDRVRVVEVITHLDVGGAQATLVSLAEFLDREACELTIVAGTRDGGPGELVPQLEALGAQVIVVPSLRRAVSLRDVRAFGELVRVFRRMRPDVVHTHSSKAGVLGRIAARVARVPSVVHTAHSWSFHARGSRIVSRACVVLERFLARLTDVIVVVADADRRTGETHGVRSRHGYELIRSGIDVRAFPRATAERRAAARATLGVPADARIIGTVSRLAAQKDPATFVRAVARVVERDAECLAVVVGEGPLAASLVALADQLGVRDHITFAGARRDVPHVLAAFDAFALSSRWEALPRVLAEAMAVGVPVVATDVKGIGEIVVHDETGVLVPVGDAEELGDALAKLLADRSRADELVGEAGARLEEFDARTMATRHARMYARLAARPVRVVHVITGLDAAGAEHMLAGVVAGMNPDRATSHVISLTDLGPVAEKIRAAGVEVEALGMRRGGLDVGAVWRLRRRLRQLRPDVVQTWLYHADLVGGVAARLAGVPVVAWNLQIAAPEGFLKSRTLATARVAGCVSGIVPTHIVACADSAVPAHAALGYDARRMGVIRNGFDVDRFRADARRRLELRREIGVDEDALVVTVAARFDPQKDHRTFVAAAGIVRTAVTGVRFVLCGNGITTDNRELARWCDDAGIAGAVHCLGARPDMERVFAATDLIVSSSVMEGFSLTVGEAMACGVPAVATDVGDNRVLVGDAGRVVPKGNAAQLAAAMIDVLRLPDAERRRLGASGAQRVRRDFSLAGAIAQYEQLYVSAGERR